MKVLLQYLTLPHYRRSLFDRLARHPELDFAIACGTRSVYAGLASFEPEPPLRTLPVRNRILRVGSHQIVWQQGLLSAAARERPDAVILLGVDPHLLSTFALFLLARLRGTSVFWWGHASGGGQGGLGRRLRALAYRAADGAFVYDEAGRDRLCEWGVEPERVFVVWNCLNDEDYPAEGAASDSGALPRLCHLGRLTREKRIDVLLEALTLLREEGTDLALDVIGDGPDRDRLAARVQELGLGRSVTLHGARYGADVSALLSRAVLAPIPGWAGLAAVQALAHGVPVLTNDDLDGQPPEAAAVVPGETGDFFRADDATALASMIRSWLPRASAASVPCRALVAARYTPDRVAEALVAGLRAVLSRA